MYSSWLSKVYQQYQIVAGKEYKNPLLAWEFDPDLYQRAFGPALKLMRDADIPYDLLQNRPENSPFRMEEQGFNLNPKAKGNDWSHVTLGTFSHLKEGEWPSIYNVAKTMVPTYTVLRAKIINAPTSGLSYLVLGLDQPKLEKKFKDFLASRYPDFSSFEMRVHAPLQPHVSLLGFAKKDETRVKILLPKIQQAILGEKMRPSYLQLWENFSVVKHSKL